MGTYGLGVSIGVSLSPRSCSWRRGLVGRMPSRARTGDRADGELPLQDSNLDYLIQSGPLGACVPVNLAGIGHLTSIGARFRRRFCPVLPGETADKRPQVLSPGGRVQGWRRRIPTRFLRLTTPRPRRSNGPSAESRFSRAPIPVAAMAQKRARRTLAVRPTNSNA